jgi:hypothetical protein
MALQVNLNKSESALRLQLTKANIAPDISAEIAFDIDVSGSYDDELRSGVVDMLLARLLPWGMVFDPNKSMDVFTFSSGHGSVHHVGTVTPQTYEGFVTRKIVRAVPGYGGGTDYSFVLEKNLVHFGWLAEQAKAESGGGFLSSLFGRKKAEPAPGSTAPLAKKRSIILFNTDGANSDQERTMEVLSASEGRQDQVYFLFLGYSNQPGTFHFLTQIGDRFKNTGLVEIRNLNQFVAQDDDALNAQLLTPELISWLKVS